MAHSSSLLAGITGHAQTATSRSVSSSASSAVPSSSRRASSLATAHGLKRSMNSLARTTGLPGVRERLVQAQLLIALGHIAVCGIGRRQQRVQRRPGVRIAERAGVPTRGRAALEILVQHGERAAGEIAEFVREADVDQLDELLERELAVAPGRDRRGQVEAQRVRAVLPGERHRIHHVAERFRQPLAARVDEAVHVHLARQRHAGREQQRRPQHAVEAADVLADQVQRVGVLRLRGAGPRRAGTAVAVQVLEFVLARSRPGRRSHPRFASHHFEYLRSGQPIADR